MKNLKDEDTKVEDVAEDFGMFLNNSITLIGKTFQVMYVILYLCIFGVLFQQPWKPVAMKRDYRTHLTSKEQPMVLLDCTANTSK